MDGVAPNLGKETEVVGGKVVKVGRWTVDVWDDLLEWAKSRIPNPWAGLDGIVSKLDPMVADKLIRDTQERANRVLSINSPDFQEVLETPEGQLQIFYLLLKQCQPAMTKQEAFEIAGQIGHEKQAEIFRKSAGKVPDSGNQSAPAA